MLNIAIHSVPRSGSSWLGEILNSSLVTKYAYQPLFSYQFKSQLSENSTIREIEQFYSGIALTKDPFVCQSKEREAGFKPNFQKAEISHIVYKEVRYHYVLENLLKKNPNQKAIGLIRNPLEVLNSWYKAPREFRKDLNWNFGEEWRYAQSKNQDKKEEYFGFEKWMETALLFERLQSQYPNKFMIINYRDLLGQTSNVVEKLYRFIDLELCGQTREFIDASTNISRTESPYSVYKKKSSKNSIIHQLPKHILEQIILDCEKHNLQQYL